MRIRHTVYCGVKRGGVEIFLYTCHCLFYVIMQTSWTNWNFMLFLKLKAKIIHWRYNYFYQSTKSPHFLLRGKFGQLRMRKRVLFWSIYIISLCSDRILHEGEDCCTRHDRPLSQYRVQSRLTIPSYHTGLAGMYRYGVPARPQSLSSPYLATTMGWPACTGMVYQHVPSLSAHST